MRVSDNTTAGTVNQSLKRTKGRMDHLTIQNSLQKRLIAPSDDPAANTKIMDIRTQKTVNSQFETNAVLSKTKLSAADAALTEMYDIFTRAKEIAISQSSDASASEDSRIGVAQEVSALYRQLVSVANRRYGQTFLFGGFKTTQPPYSADGTYHGDNGEMPIEIQKDVFIMNNIPGPQAFEVLKYKKEDRSRAPANVDKTEIPGRLGKNPIIEKQDPLSTEKINAFHELDSLRVGLLTNDTITIRDTMEKLDDIIQNNITMRAKISSRVSGIDAAINTTQKIDESNTEIASQLEDADYAEIWSNLAKEESVLRSSLSAAQKLLQPNLMDFLK